MIGVEVQCVHLFEPPAWIPNRGIDVKEFDKGLKDWSLDCWEDGTEDNNNFRSVTSKLPSSERGSDSLQRS